MIKRSEAFAKLDKHALRIYDAQDNDITACTLNRYLDALESAGVEFAPEETEPSAVEKWNRIESESPELANARNAYYVDDDKGLSEAHEVAREYVRALESELARLRSGIIGDSAGVARDK